ncbi:hypothetical protein TorRG33x02_254340 [Trema orientale]|uniref:Secreted protein n=1 Tax=Trema orientale TaxID=63057 RepID=A0A2P5DDM8_TREOI|nr:hypothetical protein TorRG33x02_254340 [Trema orientale]
MKSSFILLLLSSICCCVIKLFLDNNNQGRYPKLSLNYILRNKMKRPFSPQCSFSFVISSILKPAVYIHYETPSSAWSLLLRTTLGQFSSATSLMPSSSHLTYSDTPLYATSFDLTRVY